MGKAYAPLLHEQQLSRITSSHISGSPVNTGDRHGTCTSKNRHCVETSEINQEKLLMKNLKRSFVVLSAVGLLSVPALAGAQTPPSQPPSSPSSPQTPSSPRPDPATPPTAAPMPSQDSASAKSTTVKGELVSVDDVAKSITIKDETGAEQKFTYDDKTDVSGAKEGVAGLATKAGSKVTVKFKDGAAGKLATKIEVARAAGSQQ
jgi:hypothetical protein